ncbi:Transcription initiation factor TFIID subunit 1 [Quillaja saponaria]|uniref:Transcription initiation factor TFIID subunit 1 n=1 Tax=Quillaja saponaria TaxID=32244 RepID=A0AAD7KQ41_QUISA|nr:Transcription initiation factor TFIID subunit 1 [Quillaja saponaria]
MGYDSRSPSQDGRDEDDDEEYDEAGSSNRLLGFMFGNVDNSGDLDVDYLDEDAKEHLSALADKLGPSLTDIDLSGKSPRTPPDVVEQERLCDWDKSKIGKFHLKWDGGVYCQTLTMTKKAEDAVDYEDIDEEYDGPEIQAVTEEDYLLPKKDFFSVEVSLGALESRASVFDDENYDEEIEIEQEIVNNNSEADSISLSGEQVESLIIVSGGESSLENASQVGLLQNENLDTHLQTVQEEVPEVLKGPTPLPVLCIEDGMVILRFSEIFGIHEPLKKMEKRDNQRSLPKDRLKSLDLSDIVEEDEEAFLKGSYQSLSYDKQACSVQRNISECNEDGLDFSQFGVLHGTAPMIRTDRGLEKDSFISGEPMKEDLRDDYSVGQQSQLYTNLYPLDQQDWEEGIMWDNSPAASDYTNESREISGPDLGASSSSEIQNETGLRDTQLEPQRELEERDHSFLLCSSPVSLEPFGSRDSPGHKTNPLSESIFHPQLLRLESRFEVDKDGKKDNVAGEFHQSDSIRRFSKLTSQNREMLDGSWLDEIIWEPDRPNVKPKLILDLQDEQMLFEILDNKDCKHLRLHAGAMIITRSLTNGESSEQQGHGGQSGWRYVANDKHYSNRKTSQQLKSNSKKRSAHGVKVFHSQPALKLQTMKLKLSKLECLEQFHLGVKSVCLVNLWKVKILQIFIDQKLYGIPMTMRWLSRNKESCRHKDPVKIIMKSLGGRGSKLHVDAEETISSVKAKASKKLDFKPSETVKIFYLGTELEDHKSLAAQNVRPNSLLHLVRTKINLWPKAQRVPGENKSLRPPGAFKKKSDLSVKDGHVFLMEYCEERPLLLSNIGMGARLCTYYQKSSPDDQTGSLLRNASSSTGHVISLDPADKSPFIGDLKSGCSQSSLETNMYRAPIFPHKVQSTDYLLVRSSKGKLSLRRIDKINVVGQQEPLMEVLSPGSKNLQTYIMNRLLVYMCREFQVSDKRHSLPCVRADELLAPFPCLPEASFRKKIREYANLQKDTNGQLILVKKRNFRMWSEDELRKMVTPELVCAYESMQAGLYRLKHLGITETHPTNISSAMSRLPDEAIALAAASHIERELQITPWNLSTNFVACTSQGKENIERLEITGVGDPSGRGLGFSYARAPPKAPVSSAMVKKKAPVARGGSTVTGTDADLRRLSMEAAREVLLKFNVPEEVIAKQTRWHRIAMIRKLSSEQAASGVKVDPTTINKYARGQRMSFLQLQQQTREKCQEIWDRQIQNLSAANGDENESDSEANSDLDSFAGDLENLLDAEECEEGEEGNDVSKRDKADSVKGLKMRRNPTLAQEEEEIEDEAAEAADLRRLLMDDDDADKKKKKKTRVVSEEIGLARKLQPRFGFDNADQIKQIINAVQSNGAYNSKETTIKDSKEEEIFLTKRSKSVKVKTVKSSDIALMGLQNKKIKIAGDGVKVFKEKKNARESFVCGACGQLGHMRTNKNCPKYGEDQETQHESMDPEKASGKTNPLDPSSQSQQKTLSKKLTSKSATKIATGEASEGEKSSLKATVKFKCSSNEKLSDKLAMGTTQSSDRPVTSDPEIGKPTKIVISNKLKPDDSQAESHKPSIVIRPPVDTGKKQFEPPKPSIVIRPLANVDKDQVESPKHSVVLRPPSEFEREQSHKKIIIKRPKEVIDLDEVSPGGSTGLEHRKTKRIIELSTFEKQRKQESMYSAENSVKRKAKGDRRWLEEQEKRRNEERLREEKARRLYEEEMRMLEEQERLSELKRYEASIRREREEEERQKAKKKKKKKVEFGDEYLEDPRTRRYDKRMLERDRSVKRRSVVELGRYGAEYTPPTKRRRGGEVGLANILERIVEALKDRHEVSYLFLKPVTKKEAPDYLNIVKHPMDLSTIREKVRRMEYKCREDFRQDVLQINVNAHIYNEWRYPAIPPLADKLLELCDYLLNENDESLTEAEAGIEGRDI